MLSDVTNILAERSNKWEERMKRTSLALIIFGTGALLSFPACTKPTQEPSVSSSGGAASTAPSGAEAKKVDVALVRFVNATPAPRDLYFGDSKPFVNVSSHSVSPYVQLPSERHEFKLLPSGTAPAEPL